MVEYKSMFDDLFQRLEKLNLPIAQHFNSGLTHEEFHALLKDFPFRLPTEVYHYYQFCKPSVVARQDEYLLFPWGYIVSLAEALKTREIYMTLVNFATVMNNGEHEQEEHISNKYEIFEQPQLWHPRWLPIFSHDGPEHWVVICGKTEEATSPVYFINIMSESEFYLAYDSLTTMLLTIVEAFEIGAYYVTEDGDLGQQRVLLSPIFNKYNPKCREYHLKAAGAKGIHDLLHLLNNTSYPLLRKVQRALLLLGDSSIVTPLIDNLKGDNNNLKILAADLLGEMGDLRAINPLITVLLHDSVEPVRIASAAALGKLRSRQAIDALTSTLTVATGQLRSTIIAALSAVPDPRSVDALLALLSKDETNTQMDVMDALSVLGDLRAIEPLEEKLKSKEQAVRQAAGDALEWLEKQQTTKVS